MMDGIEPATTRASGYKRALSAVKHSLAEGRYEGGMLPSYRRLARELNVTMGHIRRAMSILEHEGLIRRERGRGVFPRTPRRSVARETPLPLQCINFVSSSHDFLPSFVFADYLAGYTEAVERLAIRMRFAAGAELTSDYERMFSPVMPIEAQGVVLINSCAPGLVEWLRRNGVPFVAQCYTRYATEHLPAHFGIYVNKPGGAVQAVNHLLELGHRRIGFMGNIDGTGAVTPVIHWTGMVFDGYRAALVCAGLDCVAGDLAHRYDMEEKRTSLATAKAFLDRAQRPTAVLAESDGYAQVLLEAARALNIRVPEELSIIGFNDQPGSAQSDPALTTVSVPRRGLAKNAVELLLEAAEGPQPPPRTRILETHLIIRKSTAPPGRGTTSGDAGG